MERNEKFSWRARGRSFGYACQGILTLIREEHNARLHLAAAALVLILGVLLGLSAWEWITVVMCIVLVLAAEALNSAVEALCDRFGPERHPLIGKAKDTAAAAVLMTACGAAISGAIIFIPKIISLFLS